MMTATKSVSALALNRLDMSHGAQVKLCSPLRYDDEFYELERAGLVYLRPVSGGTLVVLTERGADLAASRVEERWLTRRYAEMSARASV